MSNDAPPRPDARLYGALLLRAPLMLPLLLLGLALAISGAPDPTSPTATGTSGRELALPLALAGLAVAAWLLRHLPSQARALAAGIEIKAKVTRSEGVSVKVRNGAASLAPMEWRDAEGVSGKALRRATSRPWNPPINRTIVLLADPRSNRRWWEGDLPLSRPSLRDVPTHPDAPTPGMRHLLTEPWTAMAVALAGFAALFFLGFSQTGGIVGWLILALLGLAVWAAGRALETHARRKRAARIGARLSASVVALRGRANSFRMGPQPQALFWQTSDGHSGTTATHPQDGLPKPGEKITVLIDPVSHHGFWERDL